MHEPYTNLEYLLAEILNFVPYAVLFLYAFRKEFRFSRKATILPLLFLSFSFVFIDYYASYYDIPGLELLADILFILLAVIAIFLTGANIGHTLFVMLMLKNCSDFLFVFAKFMEYQFVPEQALEVYNWTYAVSLILCEIPFLTVIFIIIRKYFSFSTDDTVNAKFWNFLWIIPLFFYFAWKYLFYWGTDNLIQAELMPANNLFLLMSIVCQLIIYTGIAVLIRKYHEESRAREIIYANSLQQLQYKNIAFQIDATKRISHDLRHHFVTITSLADKGEYDRLKQYLNSCLDESDLDTTLKYCSNEILNILLVYYGSMCRENGISYNVNMQIPQELNVADSDLTILFGNLIENAYEACMRQTLSEPEINIEAHITHDNLVATIENTLPDGFVFQNSDSVRSSKRNENGIGISSCRNIVDRYGGVIRFSADETFKVQLMIPLIVL